MLGIVFALLASIAAAWASVFIRKGLVKSNSLSASIVTVLVGNIFSWPLVLLFARSPFSLSGALVFVAFGLVLGVFKILFYEGMDKVGVSVNSAIVAGSPLVSTVLAILILGEHPTTWILAGGVCVVLGAVTIQSDLKGNGISKGHWRSLFFPFSAAVLDGVGFVINKIGLNLYNEPVAGLALSYLTSLLMYTAVLIIPYARRSDSLLDGRNIRIFWKGGLVMCLCWLFSFFALQYADVAVAVPLINSCPLFILPMAYFYLGGLEKVSMRLVLGVMAIIAGVFLIVL